MAGDRIPSPVDLSNGAGGLCHALAAGFNTFAASASRGISGLLAQRLAILAAIDPLALAALVPIGGQLVGAVLSTVQGGRQLWMRNP
ncbi:hypothetical protein [Rhodobacter maris]|uniref:hypothetical protein n=1 Tax=Rhodobacter maris TaxID=446682 RepID=UPI001C3E9959|nr:hypothetical protein [Rhodobacter maris]